MRPSPETAAKGIAPSAAALEACSSLALRSISRANTPPASRMRESSTPRGTPFCFHGQPLTYLRRRAAAPPQHLALSTAAGSTNTNTMPSVGMGSWDRDGCSSSALVSMSPGSWALPAEAAQLPAGRSGCSWDVDWYTCSLSMLGEHHMGALIHAVQRGAVGGRVVRGTVSTGSRTARVARIALHHKARLTRKAEPQPSLHPDQRRAQLLVVSSTLPPFSRCALSASVSEEVSACSPWLVV